MITLFLKLLNMSISSSWTVLAVLLIRFLLKKAPKKLKLPTWFNVLLWGIVGLRLVLPFSFKSALSLIPKSGNSFDFVASHAQQIAPILPEINLTNVISQNGSLAVSSATSGNNFLIIISAIWIVGIGFMWIYSFYAYIRLRGKVETAVLLTENIFQSEAVSSPFVLGIFKPRIYIPFNISEKDISYVVAHEKAHIKRLDNLWKPLGFFLLSIYWFNPILWVGYVVLSKDIELACDEMVISSMEKQEKANYSQALLSCSSLAGGIKRQLINGCPLAFGEVGVKERIKNILNYKKPAFWVIVIGVVFCVILSVCLLTDPVEEKIVNPYVNEYVAGENGIKGNVDKAVFESVSKDFEIGANKNGEAVFKDPKKALSTFKKLYANEISYLKSEYHLPALSQSSYEVYKTYGWQVNEKTEEEHQRFAFISKFFDIYENSFKNSSSVIEEITKEALSMEDVISFSKKGANLSWEDFDKFPYEEVGSGLYIRLFQIDKVYSLCVGGGSIQEKPLYIRLTNNKTNGFIDIRTENIAEFLEKSEKYETADFNVVFGSDYMGGTFKIEPNNGFYTDNSAGINVSFGGDNYGIIDAISKGYVSYWKIVDKVTKDSKSGNCSVVKYKDGGSQKFLFKNGTTIILLNTLDGDKSIYIGGKDLKRNELPNFDYEENANKQAVSEDAKLEKVVTEEITFNGKIIYFDLESDDKNLVIKENETKEIIPFKIETVAVGVFSDKGIFENSYTITAVKDKNGKFIMKSVEKIAEE